MKIRDLTNVIEKIAPLSAQEEWDNSGLQIGSMKNELKGVLLTLDVNESVVKEAIDNNANLIISHHPVFFTPLRTINTDYFNGRLIRTLLDANISIYSSHTAFDVSNYNMSRYILDSLGVKLWEKRVSQTPYLEIGSLKKDRPAQEVLSALKKLFDVENLLINASFDTNKNIRTICALSGSGAEFIHEAKSLGADMFITGDMKYHDFELCNKLSILGVGMGHYESEKSFIEILGKIIKKNFEEKSENIPVYLSKSKNNIKMF